jgi:hypothetical protein
MKGAAQGARNGPVFSQRNPKQEMQNPQQIEYVATMQGTATK